MHGQLPLESWLALVYEELRGRADRHLRAERASVSISATELVHEAYLRVAGAPINDSTHLLALASTAMRRVLVDRARRRRAKKRGSGGSRIVLEEAQLIAPSVQADVLEIDDLLTRLAEVDPRGARVVELKVFGGLTDAQVGEILGVSDRWARRLWSHARAWLRVELERGAAL